MLAVIVKPRGAQEKWRTIILETRMYHREVTKVYHDLAKPSALSVIKCIALFLMGCGL